MAGHGHTPEHGAGFSFVNMTHPSQAKNRIARKQILSHAMKDHLRRRDCVKVRSRKGRWMADAGVEAAETTRHANLVRLQPSQSVDRGALAVVKAAHVCDLNHCMCQLGPRFACAEEPNVAFLKELPARRLSAGSKDPFRSLLRLPGLNAPLTLEVGNPSKSKPNSLDTWWADKTENDLIPLLCAHLATSLDDDLSADQTTRIFSMHVRHHLVQSIQRDIDVAGRRIADVTMLGIVYLSCDDLWRDDLTSIASNRTGSEAVIREKGRLQAWAATNMLVAKALLSVTILADILSEQPSLAQFDEHVLVEAPNARRSGCSPLHWDHDAVPSLQNSSYCSASTFALLKKLRELIELILEDELSSSSPQHAAEFLQVSLLKQTALPIEIESFQQQRISTVVRYASVLLTTAITRRMPISDSVDCASERLGVPDILRAAADAVSSTEVKNIWDDDHFWAISLFLGLMFLPASISLNGEVNSDEDQLILRRLRAPALMLIAAPVRGLALPYFESLKTVLKLQRWLEGESAKSVASEWSQLSGSGLS